VATLKKHFKLNIKKLKKKKKKKKEKRIIYIYIFKRKEKTKHLVIYVANFLIKFTTRVG
jgi:hypothetical protein